MADINSVRQTEARFGADRVSWDDLVAGARPILADLLDTARRLKRKSPKYCANRTWYRVLKPILSETVGWSAELHCPFFEHVQTMAELMADKPLEHTDACRAEWQRQEWLKTSRAFDVAYQRIYDALPNCQHDFGGCW